MDDFIDELNGRLLTAGIEYLQDPYPCTVVYGRELIEPSPGAWYSLQELYIYLQPMTRLASLVPLPALLVGSMFLTCGQSTQAIALQDSVNRGSGDFYLMISMQVGSDSRRTKVVVLPQVENLADRLFGSLTGAILGPPWSITEAGLAMGLVPSQPLVESLPRDPEISTSF